MSVDRSFIGAGFILFIPKGAMGYYGDNDPWFELDTVVIGVPALVVSALGALTAFIFFLRIRASPSTLEDNGDPERKKMSDKIEELGACISLGARAFLHKEYSYLLAVMLCLYVLVSAAVNWRTGIWYVQIVLIF